MSDCFGGCDSAAFVVGNRPLWADISTTPPRVRDRDRTAGTDARRKVTAGLADFAQRILANTGRNCNMNWPVDVAMSQHSKILEGVLVRYVSDNRA
ncbi:hypothetical protein [Paracoccus alcaliphilus]|uniref:hypothetical protein n=1 Tax=Paracoccus alcaliphilus TaxID=34002 RepID=UPI001B8B5464|nr:hypothetical protein [Paracoccus alcaliphilus]